MRFYRRTFAFLLLTCFKTLSALRRPPILHGPAGPDLRIVAVSRHSAFQHVKKCQVQQLNRDAPAHICRELDMAREMLMDPAKKDEHAAFLVPRLSNRILFTIVYRVRERHPSIYTLEAIVRDPDSDVRSSDLQHVVRQLVAENTGFLQSYPLKTWARGKYVQELHLEKCL